MNSLAKKSITLGSIVLLTSLAGTGLLVKLNKPPVEASTPNEVRSLSVKAIQVKPEDVVVNLHGFGEARTKHSIVLSTEVSGRITQVHKNLVAGNIVHEGELLFSIDDSTYVMEREKVLAQLERSKATIEKLKTESQHLQKRLVTLKRSLSIAQKQFDRTTKLQKEGIGNQMRVEDSEDKVNSVQVEIGTIQREIAVSPIAIKEMEQTIRADEALLKQAELNITRTKVFAPFNGRIKQANLDLGQFVDKYHPALAIADDSILEIPIKIDARSAQQWIQFENPPSDNTLSWFDSVAQVPCEIRWAENERSEVWQGKVARVEAFDSQTRTLTLIIEYQKTSPTQENKTTFPLVSGMFCDISIPGKTMSNVYAIPYGAVGLDNEVYISQDNRLMATPVKVLRIEGETAYIDQGLSDDDIVITTRLVNPLNNTLLKLIMEPNSVSSAPEILQEMM